MPDPAPGSVLGVCAADDMDELVSAVRHAIQACCIQVYCCEELLEKSGETSLESPFLAALCSEGVQSCQAHVCLPCLQLKVKITKRIAAKEQQQRRKNLLRYIDSAAAAIFPVLQHLADTQPKGTKRRLLQVRTCVGLPGHSARVPCQLSEAEFVGGR